MKKTTILLGLSFLFLTTSVLAHPRHYNNHLHHYSGCSSNCVYIIESNNFQEEKSFKNCTNHTLLVNGTTNYYSNGAIRTHYSYSVLNQDKTPLISNCSDIKHIIYNKKHYFIAKQNKYYKIITQLFFYFKSPL